MVRNEENFQDMRRAATTLGASKEGSLTCPWPRAEVQTSSERAWLGLSACGYKAATAELSGWRGRLRWSEILLEAIGRKTTERAREAAGHGVLLTTAL